MSPKRNITERFFKRCCSFLKIYLFQVKDGLDLNLKPSSYRIEETQAMFSGSTNPDISPVPSSSPSRKTQCYEKTERDTLSLKDLKEFATTFPWS